MVDAESDPQESRDQCHQGRGHREVKTVRGDHLLRRDHGASNGLFLCCVCHEQNTTYRYEVVYRSTSITQQQQNTTQQQIFHSDSILQRVEYSSPPRRLGRKHSEEDSDGSEDSGHEYYNFPPRHPRHGHLQWPIFDAAKAVAYDEKLCLTYPDYPVHIPTTTLTRVVVVGGKNKKKSVTSSPVKNRKKKSSQKSVKSNSKSKKSNQKVTKTSTSQKGRNKDTLTKKKFLKSN